MCIRDSNNSEENCYVNALTLNGKPYSHNYITRTDLMNGAQFVYEMCIRDRLKSLSILLPSYNNDCRPLITALHSQAPSYRCKSWWLRDVCPCLLYTSV